MTPGNCNTTNAFWKCNHHCTQQQQQQQHTLQHIMKNVKRGRLATPNYFSVYVPNGTKRVDTSSGHQAVSMTRVIVFLVNAGQLLLVTQNAVAGADVDGWAVGREGGTRPTAKYFADPTNLLRMDYFVTQSSTSTYSAAYAHFCRRSRFIVWQATSANKPLLSVQYRIPALKQVKC